MSTRTLRKITFSTLSDMGSLLKLDVDEYTRPLSIGTLCRRLRRAGYAMVWMSQRRSPGGRGWHIVCEVSPQPLIAEEVVALQACLGSDPAREACNLRRARLLRNPQVSAYWRERWNVLYR